MSRWPLIITALCVALAAGVLLLVPPPGAAAAQAGEARPFRLRSTAGQVTTEADLRGQVAVLYFGYTSCPDVCPTELGYLARVLRALGPDADQVAPRFVTIDPQRDTPALLDGYVPLFHPRLQALTGTPEELAAACATFGVVARRVDTPGGGGHYLMDHTSTLFVLDRQGRAAAQLSSHDPVARSVATLRQVLAQP